ncbi:MAG: protein translocase subunit SecF [Elusimicrobiaceae bacterium]|nr:protein translocase subunit SecF [Elusimicrobiaceae bacterium]
MICLIPKTNFDFVKNRFTFFAISGLLVLGSILTIAVKGFNYGLDFSGGTMLQVDFRQPTDIGTIRTALEKAGITPEIQTYSGGSSYAIRVKGSQDNVNEIGNRIKSALDTVSAGYSVGRVEYVGPAVGRDLSKKAIWAMVLSLFGIIIYVAFRFSNPIWGVMGVLGQFHDILIVVGALAITGREINLITVAALLTIAGYSINDTIVIFDRMRENMHLNPRIKLYDLINLSVNETMSRTVITTLTVFLASIILYFLGGPVLNDFAFAMLVGVICGVYSTVTIATTLLYQFVEGSKNNSASNSAQLTEKKPAFAKIAADANTAPPAAGNKLRASKKSSRRRR